MAVTEETAHTGGRWIEHWEPENSSFWESTGKKIANRNLWFSIFVEHIGFSVWTLWSVFVLFMGPAYHIDAAGKFFLVSTPALVGSILRVPYTFAVARFGGRNWTVISGLLLLIPAVLAAVVLHPGTSYTTFVLIAALAGFGGGNFASSMTNINTFFPEGRKGLALGLNAGGGNIGVAVAQLLGLGVIASVGVTHPRVLLAVYIPAIVIACTCAALFMDNLSSVRNDRGAAADALRDPHTAMMSFLYIGTFGSFIGYSAAFPTLLKTVFGRGDIALAWAFLGAGIGSVIRPVGGKLADRIGGARITAVSFVMLATGAAAALWSVNTKNLPMFFASFMFLFVATGVGNGSTYRMISRIFKVKGELAGGDPDTMVHMRRQAAGALGVISSIGAFGGFIVPLAYAWSKSQFGSIEPALRFYVAFFLAMLGVTWYFYLRKKTRMGQLGV
jgi:NNP family nitrate/nitrite transporter-like MFS transporter